MKISLIIAEAALELIPQKIASLPACRSTAEKAKKRPTKMILDGSVHHSAMRKLTDRDKRGRPDIVHFCLLEALGSPLNRAGLLDTWVHTYTDRVLHFDPGLKLPRNQDRFKGVIEKLYEDGGLDNRLISLEEDASLAGLADRLGPDAVIGLVDGAGAGLGEILDRIGLPDMAVSEAGEPGQKAEPAGSRPGGIALVVGGFAHGQFTEESLDAMTHRASVYKEPLDAWTVVSRALGTVERRVGIMGI